MIGIDEGLLPGAAMLEEMQLHGPVVNVRFLWEDFIVTAEPQDIKVRCTACRVSFPYIDESITRLFWPLISTTTSKVRAA